MTKRSTFKYFKTSPEIIRLAVMMCVRYPLSLRNVEDLLHERDSLGFLFASRGFDTKTWRSGEEFLAHWPQADCGCIILDVRMEGMSGPQVLDALMQSEGRGAVLPPVTFLTGHADVPLAVQSLKSGAFDFLEKPFNNNQIVDLALSAMEEYQGRALENDTRQTIAARFASLSAREAEAMTLILEGCLNEEIADKINIAMRTVEVHRLRVLQKTGARNTVELAQMHARFTGQ